MSERGYLDTSEQAEAVGEAALEYIMTGNIEDGLPKRLRGLPVFGVIGALREHDPYLHGEEGVLDEAQQGRLDLLEAAVDEVVSTNGHYFPFGHNAERYEVDTTRLDVDSGWASNRKSGSHTRLRDMGMTNRDPRKK